MSTDDRVWDAGLQPERTALAWRRVSLALLALALVAPKLTWPVFGIWAIPPTAAVAIAAIVLYSLSHRRYLGHHSRLSAGAERPLPDGRLVLATALTVLSLAVLGLALVLTASVSQH